METLNHFVIDLYKATALIIPLCTASTNTTSSPGKKTNLTEDERHQMQIIEAYVQTLA
jgi:hypothetical protein